MKNETDLEKEITEYARLATQDKNVDVAGLMLNALNKESAFLTVKEKRVAYFVSLLVPPVGLYFAAKFYKSGKEDGQSAAIMCILLTILSIASFWLMAKVLTGGSSGADLTQIKDIKPQDYRDFLTQ
jgi:hypothetical protein